MIKHDLKRHRRYEKTSHAKAQRGKDFHIVCGRVFGNRALVRAMVFAGLFLLMSLGAVSGQEKDPASSSSITQSTGDSGATKPQAIQIPTATAPQTATGLQTVPGSQTIRGPIMGNQAASQSQAAAPLDSSASANGDIRDIRGPLHIPDPITWLYYGVAGCLFLLALMWFWKWIAGRKKIREKLPFELALEQLERAKAFMKPETAGRFSVMVSKAVRTYIESRFEMEVTRHTTEEFMRRVAAEPSGEIKEYGGLLNGFLGYCDLAKFARYALTMKQMEEMLQSARHFVDVTKPSPDDQKTNHKEIEGDPAVDNVPVRNKPSLMKRWWEKGFRFTSRKTTAPVSLDHPGAVAAGGR
jgi:hypothetical protein